MPLNSHYIMICIRVLVYLQFFWVDWNPPY
nr:MAG TPA: hypothetical protein [Caudoviricetes sp.]